VRGRVAFSFNAQPWLFLTLTLGVTWLLGLTAVALQNRLPNALVLALAYGGALSPIGVAALLAWRHGRSYWRDFWRRVVDWRRIGGRWLLVILLFFPLRMALAALLDAVQGGSGLALEAAADLAARPWLVFPMLLFWLFFGPVPEEPGWRGYALDGLQSRYDAVTSSLIVGVFWLAWHLPLFFLAGTWQATYLGFGTRLFWLWAVSIVSESVLYTWIYNNTNRSTLAAILFHFAGNATGELFAISPQAEIYRTALTVTAVVLVIAIRGRRFLTA